MIKLKHLILLLENGICSIDLHLEKVRFDVKSETMRLILGPEKQTQQML